MSPNPAQEAFDRVEAALRDIRAGKMIVVTDDEGRENEGDLIAAAEHATPEMVNFMAVTTVVRMSGDCELSAFCSSGNSFSGSIRQSLPKHSATTLRVPSS